MERGPQFGEQITRNEQESGSSPLVGSLFSSRFAGKISEVQNVVVLEKLPLDTTRARSLLVSREAETR
jgi:hypothetical protein